jgi:hypothetical protein
MSRDDRFQAKLRARFDPPEPTGSDSMDLIAKE